MKIKIPYFLKDKLFNILQPQLVVKYSVSLNGKVVRKNFCESLNANFLLAVYHGFRNNTTTDFVSSDSPFNDYMIINTGGSGASGAGSVLRINGLSGIDTLGIAVGAGVTPAVPLDFDLETKIANGTGAGQLSYATTQGVQGIKITGSKSNFILQRLFVNNSGGSIDVSEIGILASNGATGLILRDTFTPVTVLNGQTLLTQFEFSVIT